MTTHRDDRYADLSGLADLANAGDDPALARLLERLDLTLGPRAAPPALHATLDHMLQQRISASSAPVTAVQREPGGLSRRTALKVAAASMAWLLTLGQTGPEVAE